MPSPQTESAGEASRLTGAQSRMVAICLTQVIALAAPWWGGPPGPRGARLVPLPEAEAGASARARAPAPLSCCQLHRPESSGWPPRGFCTEAAMDNRLTLTILPSGLRLLRSAQAPPQGQPGPARATTRGLYLWMAGAVSRPDGDTPLRKATAST